MEFLYSPTEVVKFIFIPHIVLKRFFQRVFLEQWVIYYYFLSFFIVDAFFTTKNSSNENIILSSFFDLSF